MTESQSWCGVAFLVAQAADKCSVGVREDTQEYALN